jgi:hypothetical protein
MRDWQALTKRDSHPFAAALQQTVCRKNARKIILRLYRAFDDAALFSEGGAFGPKH